MDQPPLPLPLPATRAAGLARLDAFLPRAGRAYAAHRNEDAPGHPAVSGLSPYLRHRLITEAEVLAAVQAHHPTGADKFLAEVWWRTYWKGWLERRPGIWAGYTQGLTAALQRMGGEAGLRADWDAACTGTTGIDGFDHWARELVASGYMHNHARMWFASIWIFTLRLPWELGADFFLRHLIDGDPASNTLSWRWVGGLHTPGKTYLARPDNIARYTDGRFRPTGLATRADPLPMSPHPAPRAMPQGDDIPAGPSVLLITEEDLSPEFLLEAGLNPQAIAVLTAPDARSPLATGTVALDFTARGITDCLHRLATPDAPRFAKTDLAALADWAQAQGAQAVVTPYAPTGPIARLLRDLAPLLHDRGITLHRILRDHDRGAWPHATGGFFKFREAVMG
ncbi:MAG: FAD-binding domain-containing protein [Pseudomonadota bacterium]